MKVCPMEQIDTASLPQNLEAEQALLGAILANNKAYEKVSEFLRPYHFADSIHAKVFEVIGIRPDPKRDVNTRAVRAKTQNRRPPGKARQNVAKLHVRRKLLEVQRVLRGKYVLLLVLDINRHPRLKRQVLDLLHVRLGECAVAGPELRCEDGGLRPHVRQFLQNDETC